MEPKKAQDPDELGGWRINGRLGEGGFGTVFLAQKGAQKAAIKIVREAIDAETDGAERFHLEIAALKKLVDPYIAKIIDSDLESAIPWFATEFVNGPTLEEKVRYEGVLEERAWFNLAANLFHALSTSHAAGVVHKDVKPSNIILGETGNKLIDFGIAHVSGQTRVVNFGEFEGSRPYSSPESSTGKSLPGMDVFSAAATLAFAGQVRSIWQGNSEMHLMRSINEDEPDLSELSELQRTFLGPLLNKNASDRPTAKDAYNLCLNILSKLDASRDLINLGGWKKLIKNKKSKATGVKIGIASTLILILVGSGIFLSINQPNGQTPQSSNALEIATPSPTTSTGESAVKDTSPLTKEIQANLDLTKKFFEEKNYEKSLVYAKKAADAGNAHGMYNVAFVLVAQGKSTEAIVWYEKASALNYGDAFLNLGNLYSDQEKTELALNWYEKGASQNNIGSINNLGLYYGNRDQNTKALTYYLKSAKLGSVMGMANLGKVYERLNDDSSAKKWYTKAVAQGDLDSAINIGYIYEKNSEWASAKKYYQIAADKKDPLGMYNLAIVLGNRFGQGDKGCLLLKEAITVKTIDADTKKLVEQAIVKGCSATAATASAKPQPIPSSTALSVSAPLSANVVKEGIFGRVFKSGLDWVIPLTNSNSDPVPPITGVQFRIIGFPDAGWMGLPYQLKKSDYGVRANVDDLFLAVLFKKEVCPEFRFVQEVDGKIAHIWTKGQPECATNYVP